MGSPGKREKMGPGHRVARRVTGGTTGDKLCNRTLASFATAGLRRQGEVGMRIKVVVHEAEEGGYWAEVPSVPGCATQGETFEELLQNLYEAVEGCLSVDVEPPKPGDKGRVLEIAV